MTRRPVDAPGQSALYAWLLDREEREAELRHSVGIPLPGNATRLAALRAGEPVDVNVSDLPPWARERETVHWWRRAIVTADGALEFYDDRGAAWLAEQGL